MWLLMPIFMGLIVIGSGSDYNDTDSFTHKDENTFHDESKMLIQQRMRYLFTVENHRSSFITGCLEILISK